MTSTDPGVTILGALATYNVVQNLILPENAYVPANLAMTAGLITFGRRSGLSLASMGLGGNRLQDGLLLGTAVGVAVGGAALAGAAHDRSSRLLLDERARGHGRGQAAYRVLARFPLGTALFEEVAFRGVLDGIWRFRRGKRAARLATAAAFGAARGFTVLLSAAVRTPDDLRDLHRRIDTFDVGVRRAVATVSGLLGVVVAISMGG